jgi:transforming growth factor-beta-induced protein
MMKKMLRTILSLAIASCAAGSAVAADIVDTAVGAGKFKTLAAALGAADLVDTLKGPGPFTVFAPTDEAFAKLPAGTVESLVKPENKAKLAAILTYHVVSGRVMAKEAMGLKGAVTVNGQRIDIKVDGSMVMIDGAKVVTADIQCDNGVIHVIDSVILPADKNIPETATAAKKFTTLLAAVKAAGLAEVLSGPGPFTVFAPTDEAFGKLPGGTVESLLKPENKQKLVDILKYHVVPTRVYSEGAVKAGTAKTLEGQSITISASSGGAKVNSSNLVATDVDASNGVIHIIDAVLMPPAKGANARQVLQHTVAVGSQMFNAGDHAGCATLYKSTLNDLMSADIHSSLKAHMTSVLHKAQSQSCVTEQSWTLRHGIDQLYTQLAK